MTEAKKCAAGAGAAAAKRCRDRERSDREVATSADPNEGCVPRNTLGAARETGMTGR